MSGVNAPLPRCACCGKTTFSNVMSSRSWCPGCEEEFKRCLMYLETLAKMARYAMVKGY